MKFSSSSFFTRRYHCQRYTPGPNYYTGRELADAAIDSHRYKPFMYSDHQPNDSGTVGQSLPYHGQFSSSDSMRRTASYPHSANLPQLLPFNPAFTSAYQYSSPIQCEVFTPSLTTHHTRANPELGFLPSMPSRLHLQRRESSQEKGMVDRHYLLPSNSVSQATSAGKPFPSVLLDVQHSPQELALVNGHSSYKQQQALLGQTHEQPPNRAQTNGDNDEQDRSRPLPIAAPELQRSTSAEGPWLQPQRRSVIRNTKSYEYASEWPIREHSSQLKNELEHSSSQIGEPPALIPFLKC